MKMLDEPTFLRWAQRTGISLDERYPQSAVLTFGRDRSTARFWEVPPEPERRPFFISALLALMGEWRSCYVWRHLGSWPQSAEPTRVNDVVEFQILKGLGFPLGTADIVEIPREELTTLITLVFTTSIFGWSVGEDLYVVPDHARYLLQTDHHGVIHVMFRELGDVGQWVTAMAANGFTLPDDVPDETFKRPSCMKDG